MKAREIFQSSPDLLSWAPDPKIRSLMVPASSVCVVLSSSWLMIATTPSCRKPRLHLGKSPNSKLELLMVTKWGVIQYQNPVFLDVLKSIGCDISMAISAVFLYFHSHGVRRLSPRQNCVSSLRMEPGSRTLWRQALGQPSLRLGEYTEDRVEYLYMCMCNIHMYIYIYIWYVYIFLLKKFRNSWCHQPVIFPGKRKKTIYKTVDSLPFIFSRGLGLTVVGCLEDPRIPTDYQECYTVLSENADKAIIKSIFGGIASMNLAEQLR